MELPQTDSEGSQPMSEILKKQEQESRLAGDEILIAIGCRLYEAFCSNCNRVLIEEDSHCMRLQCQSCKKIFAYRVDQEKERAIFEFSTGKVSIQ